MRECGEEGIVCACVPLRVVFLISPRFVGSTPSVGVSRLKSYGDRLAKEGCDREPRAMSVLEGVDGDEG